MRDILSDLDRWQQQNEEIALATLVAVRGSAPRAAGARMCATRSGRVAGSISGGCVDGDVLERAMQVLNDVHTSVATVATYGVADELSLEVGLTCGGSIDVLIEPFADDGAWRSVRDAIESRRPAALAVGLAPGELLGRRLAVLEGAPCVGSIDPELDPVLVEAAERLLCEGGTRQLALPWLAMERRAVEAAELPAGDRAGEARVFIEAFPPPLRLYIVGATHTAIPLCRMAKELGYRVSVIDPRSTFATEERFPDADELTQLWPDEALSGVSLDAYSVVLTLIHDPKFDVPALEHALRSGASYVGALGSRSTHEARKTRLRDKGFSEDDLAQIRAPIGLDIGARTPEEIALAILAEVVAVRHGRGGGALRDRRAPIHGDG
jgi:xanthine dehydrogenase accessory factor